MHLFARLFLLCCCLTAPLLAQASVWRPGPLSLVRPLNLIQALQDPAAVAAQRLIAAESSLTTPVAQRAMQAVLCAQDSGMTVETLLVVDMAAPAHQRRLWAFDLRKPGAPRLVLHDYVAHGSGSDPDGDGRAEQFSNRPNSHMTSLGLYRVAERYHGKNGWSRRLDGLFDRFNGRARERAVVMHPSTYVVPGRVGRSQGCPAVSEATMRALERAGLTNAVLWIDAPDSALAEEVATCSQQRRQALLAQALQAMRAPDTRPAIVMQPAPATPTHAATPSWPHWPDAQACRLTTPSARRWERITAATAQLDRAAAGSTVFL